MCGEDHWCVFVTSGTLSSVTECIELLQNGANVCPEHTLLSHVQEGLGWLEKCLAESPLVRHVWGTLLVYVCNFWDSIKCHRMHTLTADGANVLLLHAMLTHV